MTGKNNSEKQLMHESAMKNFRKQLVSVNTTIQNNWIPEEIQFSILRNLPGKAVMRFKCVSKAWNSMISDPNFISKTPQLILSSLFSIYLLNCEVSSIKATKLNIPIKDKNGSFLSVMASCNGILWVKVDDENLLWNPFTGEHKTMPNGPSYIGANHGYGFGYDHTTKDYKIICIPTRAPQKPFSYSVKNDSCESLEEIIPYYSTMIFHRKEGISMKKGNFLCWPIVYFCQIMDLRNRRNGNRSCVFCDKERSRKPHLLILEFDLVNRKQVLFPQPLKVYNWDDHTKQVRKLMDFKGSLCAVIEDHINQITDMWLLKEDNCKRNWVKFMSIDFNNLDFWAQPIHIRSDEEVLMSDISQGEIVCYDHNNSKNRFLSVKIDEIDSWHHQISYSQTLASIQS